MAGWPACVASHTATMKIERNILKWLAGVASWLASQCNTASLLTTTNTAAATTSILMGQGWYKWYIHFLTVGWRPTRNRHSGADDIWFRPAVHSLILDVTWVFSTLFSQLGDILTHHSLFRRLPRHFWPHSHHLKCCSHCWRTVHSA